MALCELKNVTKTYLTGESVMPVKNVNFSVEKGDFIAITGESGIGKTTLLMLAGGLLKPTDGNVYIDGQDYWTLSDVKQTELRAQKIGYLFQTIQMVQALTIGENMEFAAKLCGRDKKSDIDSILDSLGLLEKRNSLPMHLSGGQKRRAMIAIAVVRDPDLIFADEPTNDLDSEWESKVMELFEEWTSQGKAIVMVTHNKELAKKAKRCFEIQNRVLIQK